MKTPCSSLRCGQEFMVDRKPQAPVMRPGDTMKYEIWAFIEDGGDGSVAVRFFNTEGDAETYADVFDGDREERHEGDVQRVMLEFNGTRLTNPDVPYPIG